MDLDLIGLVDITFNGMLSDPLYRYTDLQVDLDLIGLVDITFNGMFSDPLCKYMDL